MKLFRVDDGGKAVARWLKKQVGELRVFDFSTDADVDNFEDGFDIIVTRNIVEFDHPVEVLRELTNIAPRLALSTPWLEEEKIEERVVGFDPEKLSLTLRQGWWKTSEVKVFFDGTDFFQCVGATRIAIPRSDRFR